MNLHGHFE